MAVANQKKPTRRSVKNSTPSEKNNKSSNKGKFQLPYLLVFLIIAFLFIFGIFDYFSSFNRITAGIKIDGAEMANYDFSQAKSVLEQKRQLALNSKVLYIANDKQVFENLNLEDYYNNQNAISEQISAQQASQNVKVFQTSASDIGAQYNYDQVISKAIDASNHRNFLVRFISCLFGQNYDLNLEFGDGADNLYAQVSKNVGEAHVDFGIEIKGAIANVTDGKDGTAINKNNFFDTIAKELKKDENNVSKLLFVPEYDPIRISYDQAKFVADQINAMLSKPKKMQFNSHDFEFGVDLIAKCITTRTEERDSNYYLKAEFDNSLTTSTLSTLIKENVGINKVPVKFEKIEDNQQILVHPQGDVVTPKLDRAIDDLNNELMSITNSDSTLHIESSDQKDNFDIKSALDYGIIDNISSYTTTYTSTSATQNRNHNIHLVSDLITNSIISANGGYFSFNDTAGPCGAEQGFLDAGAISGGEVVQAVAGGICQVATTVFNAAYDAGMPIIERHEHALRMLSYPSGRDAAVYIPTEDLVWKNDTESDQLMQVTYTDTSVTSAILGVSPNRTVETVTGEFQKGESYSTKYVQDDSLASDKWYVRTVGVDGSKISIERKVYNSSGTLLYDNFFVSTYGKIDEVIAMGKDVNKNDIQNSRKKVDEG